MLTIWLLLGLLGLIQVVRSIRASQVEQKRRKRVMDDFEQGKPLRDWRPKDR